jgi:heme exporter protein D
MTHLPFIAGSYGLALGVAVFFGFGTSFRLRRARGRLAALERKTREGGSQ